MLAAVLLVTATATFLYGRKIHAGTVPPLSDEELRAKELAASGAPAEEPLHPDAPSGSSVPPRKKTQ